MKRASDKPWLAAAFLLVGLAWASRVAAEPLAPPRPNEASASTTAPGASPSGAIDGDRFALKPGTFWKGAGAASTWWWQVRFAEPRLVGAILQVHTATSRPFSPPPRNDIVGNPARTAIAGRI